MQFGDKIRFAVSILRFVDVRPDTGSGSADLIGNDRFALVFKNFTKFSICTAKSTDNVRNLLSAIRSSPFGS